MPILVSQVLVFHPLFVCISCSCVSLQSPVENAPTTPPIAPGYSLLKLKKKFLRKYQKILWHKMAWRTCWDISAYYEAMAVITQYVSVTLLLEKQHKEFTSDKPICPLQFGTIIHIIGLSLTFKTIKQKIQVFQLSELISFCFCFGAILKKEWAEKIFSWTSLT